MKKKILVVGDISSVHLFRWCSNLSGSSIDILSFERSSNFKYEMADRVLIPRFGRISRAIHFVKALWICLISTGAVVNFHALSRKNALLALFCRAPYIFTCYGTDVLRNLKHSAGLERGLYLLALRRAYAITSDSDSVCSTVLKEDTRIQASNTKVLMWGVDTNHFIIPRIEEKLALRRYYGIPEDSVVLLSIRTLTPHYRILEIIEWFLRMNQAANHRLFIHVNEYGDRAYVERCKQLSLSDERIVFHDWETGLDRVPDYYKLSDVSLYYALSDSTPISMLEAIGCGHLIYASPGIPSYQAAARKYTINLRELDDLVASLIDQELVAHREKSIVVNRDILLRTDSRAVAISNVQALFDRASGKEELGHE